MIQAPEEVLQIRLQHPTHLAPGDDLVEGRQRMMGAQPCSPAQGTRQEVLLVDGGQHFGRAALERPVTHAGHP
jgi:hypothetical protein